jgi:uncharacterized protein (DUF58 family)
MHLRRCASGISLLAILLIATAYILDDLVVLFSGVSLCMMMLVGYSRFLYLVRNTVRSVEIQRTAERSRILKGATIRVSTSITIQVPPGMEVKVNEVLPYSLAVQDGITSLQVHGSPSPARHSLTYRITPVVHGEFQFPGISLEIRDYFFTTTFHLICEGYNGPLLTVQPVGLFESSSPWSGGTREIDKMNLVSGIGIRSLREYYAGDNIRNIDWKLSAKFGKLFVREYMGTVNLPPLIIIDLPWSGSPCPDRDFDRMVTSVAGVAEQAVRNCQSVSLLLVSGPNVLEFIAEEKDAQHCMSRLREWMHPVERTVHQYRTRDRSELRLMARTLETRSQGEVDNRLLPFYSCLKKWYLTGIPSQKPTVFAGQLNRVFPSLAVDEIYLFTPGAGDTSHIRQIIRLARAMKFRVHLRTPSVGTESFEPSFWGRLGVDTLEAFA